VKTLLVANRGEIALRVMRSAKELGLRTIAVYSEADRNALHVAYADEAYLLGPAAPAQSYLNVERLLAVAARANADAVHPGYGFLAENAAFAQAVVGAGITWVGPHPGAIEAMGDKIRARQAMVVAGIPVVPGGTTALESVDDALAAAQKYGLPQGLKVARSEAEISAAFTTARREAEAYFKNSTIYAERYLENPKHVELQILADKHGTVLHVGERDCSLQRRHQKLLEETPAAIAPGVRERLREAGVRAARTIGYDSVGTIETLVSGDDFYFLEMNTRIQVEHTITEMVSGIDLIREQLRVAAGEPLGFYQADIDLRGHALEVRVNAEDPGNGFAPAPGRLTTYREPAGFGVRVDAAVAAGATVSPDYDSLVAKLIVWGRDRAEALERLRRAIDDYAIGGVATTLPFLRALLDEPSVRDSTYGTATLERFASSWPATTGAAEHAEAAAAPSELIRVEVNDKLYRVRVLDRPAGAATTATRRAPPRPASAGSPSAANASPGNAILAPMHGAVVEITVAAGGTVAEGQVVAVIEAMKMMNEIRAHRSGVVKDVLVTAGATVEARTPLIALE
jgi:acetyl-CoA/propionyl-CoA carboxylase biotin carboxyl carrier protein